MKKTNPHASTLKRKLMHKAEKHGVMHHFPSEQPALPPAAFAHACLVRHASVGISSIATRMNSFEARDRERFGWNPTPSVRE